MNPPESPNPKNQSETTSLMCVNDGVLSENYGLGTTRKWDIFLYQANGGQLSFAGNVTSKIQYSVRNPSWMPDGCSFVAQILLSDKWQIAVINIDGTIQKILHTDFAAIQPEAVAADLVMFVRESDKQMFFWDPAMDLMSEIPGAVGQMPNSAIYDGFPVYAYQGLDRNLVIREADGRINKYAQYCAYPEWLPRATGVVCHTTQHETVTVSYPGGEVMSTNYQDLASTAIDPLDQANRFVTWGFDAYQSNALVMKNLEAPMVTGAGSDWIDLGGTR